VGGQNIDPPPPPSDLINQNFYLATAAGIVEHLGTKRLTRRSTSLTTTTTTTPMESQQPGSLAATSAALMKEYLLRPARLPDIVTFEQFRDMFPRASRSSPHVKTLYRDLQAQRAALVDAVEERIDEHAAELEELQQYMREEERETELQQLAGDDVEVDIERAMFGAEAMGGGGAGGDLRQPVHTIETILPAMESAAEALEEEIKKLEEEEQKLLDELRKGVSNLSDLRYGKPENSNLREEILESLETFQATCEEKS
jgi:centromere-localized protein 2